MATECAWGRKLVNTEMPLQPCPDQPTMVLVIDDKGDKMTLDLCASHMEQLEVLGLVDG